MRPIDADALIEEANADGAYGYVNIKQIMDAPTLDVIPAPNYRVPSTEEWMERYCTKKQLARYEKRKECGDNA